MDGHPRESAFDGACDRGAISLLGTLVLAATSALAVEQALPPQIELIPLPNAANVAKHPALPVLYVSCDDAPESRNLVTYRLQPDGSLDAASRQACADYFSPDGVRPSFRHRLFRAAVNAEKRVLYLAASPTTANSVMTYADTNNFEFAAVRLDETGQPRERLKAFRSEATGQQGLIDGVRHEPTLKKCFATYYSTIQWLDLDEDGLPVEGVNRWIPWLTEYQQWRYETDWNRFFAQRTTSMLINFIWEPGAPGMEFIQAAEATAGRPQPGVLPVSRDLRKLYLLDSASPRDLLVVPLGDRGSFVGVPRRFDIGPASHLVCDFPRRKLYSFGGKQARVFDLDAEGFPCATPRNFALDVGDIRDALLDEGSGRLYIACTKPSGAETK